MEYKTIKEISELWGVSPAMIRKYCSQGRIPGAKRETGGWMIPSKSEKPEASSTSPIKAKGTPSRPRKKSCWSFPKNLMNFTNGPNRIFMSNPEKL